MSLDWEHGFEPGFPIYLQVSRGNLLFHLSEYSADCSPDAKPFVNTDDPGGLSREFTSRDYSYCRRKLQQQPGATGARSGRSVFE
ncbi:MAG TPA: glyoxalase superfamily protein [Gammaproteobacteria bacterium]